MPVKVDDAIDGSPDLDAEESPPPPDGGEPDPGDSGRYNGPWVTVATYWQPPGVHVARLRLEAADIPCMILDENLVATDWFFASAIGGIKLQVPLADATFARELLANPAGPVIAEEPIYDGLVHCPRCGSTRVHAERLSRRLVFLSILVLGAPLPIFSRHSRCEDCGETWR
jgi:hypothetical protein